MDLVSFGKRVLKVRQKTELNQTRFARFTDVARSYLSAIESGEKKPSFNFIMSILSATKVSADWLLTGEGAMYLPTKKEKEEIKGINEDRVAYGADNSPGLDDELNGFKSHWSKLNDEQKRALMVVVKEMVKNNNEILLEENRRLKDFLIKIATKTHGEIPLNVVQGLTD
jgi:transcriptional regulator with XRE-family HTH domain